MIAENDRKSLIKYRLNQAFETIELVQFLISSGKFLVAMNRIYYGMYYSLTALRFLTDMRPQNIISLLDGSIRNSFQAE